MSYSAFKELQQNFLAEFDALQPAMAAIGDVVRQGIIKTLVETGGVGGIRVGEIQKRTSISRSAVSHHLKILLDAAIINVRKEGTKNFYYIDPQSSSLLQMKQLWIDAEQLMRLCAEVSAERSSS